MLIIATLTDEKEIIPDQAINSDNIQSSNQEHKNTGHVALFINPF